MLAKRIADEAVIVLTTSTPTATSAERTRLMGLLAADLLTAIDRPEAFEALRDRCRFIAGIGGWAAAGDIFDAVSHATAVVHEGDPSFGTVIRAVAAISERLEPEFALQATYAVAV